MLRQLDGDLWVEERPFKYFGVEVGLRMSVIRLPGGLLLHSPVRLDESTRAALDAIGPVRFVLAPNRFHHLFAGDYKLAYPEAQLLGAPGLERKRKDLRFDAIIDEKLPPEVFAEFDHIVFHAFSPLNEIVLFHRRSRTALFTDLIFNLTNPKSYFERFMLRLDGACGHPAVARSFRALLWMNRTRALEELARILSWDFDRVTMAHGELIERDGKNAVRAAWGFLS
jgi:Domain of unknown function (DUF4336)